MFKFSRLFTVTLLLLNSIYAFSQYDQGFNYLNEIAQRASVPKSPEAAAFSRYGDVAVNMYAGQPNIAVPIYTHKGVEMDLPISLTYDAKGIGVNQLPTAVGLGWSLNAGGMISRDVNGLPDDYTFVTGPYLSWYSASVKSKMNLYSENQYRFGQGSGGSKLYGSENEALNYLEFLEDIHNQKIEAQPDIYTVSAPGLSCSFMLSIQNKLPYSLNNPNIKISITQGQGNLHSASGGGNGMGGVTAFKVVSDNGTSYYFESVEETQIIRANDTGGSGGDQTLYATHVKYKSSWYLTKMISPNGKDEYDFQYTSFIDNRIEAAQSVIGEGTTVLYSNINDRTESYQYSSTTTSYHNRQVLHKVLHNQKVITEFTRSNNYGGGPDVAITAIEIFNDGTLTAGTDLSKSYQLGYSYFKTGAGEVIEIANKDHIRLKLDEIKIFDAQNDELSDYAFDYFGEQEISKIGTRGQDYLGLYNGADSNQNLLSYTSNYNIPFQNINSGNRSPSFSNAIKGTLQKIKYPTGGHSIFEYEQAMYRYPNSSIESQTETKAILINQSNALPPFNTETCNQYVHNGMDITPNVVSQSFELGYLEDGLHEILFTVTGSSTNSGLSSIPARQAMLIRKPDPEVNYSWSDILDSDCNLLINPADLIWYTGSSMSEPADVQLNVGHYQLVTALYDTGFTQTLEINGPVPISVITYIEEPRAGIRIKSISDYTDNSTIAKRKTYTYLGSRQLSKPVFEYVTQERFYAPQQNQGEIEVQNHLVAHRVAQPMNGDSQHMVYTSVRETIEDPNNSANNISRTINFNTNTSHQGVHGIGKYQLSVSNAGGSFSPSHYSKFPGYGEVKRSSTSNSLTTKEFNSDFPLHFQNFGLSTVAIGRNNDKFPTIASNGDGTFYIRMLSSVPTPAMGGDGLAYLTPPECNGNPHCRPEIARLMLYKTNYYGYHGGDIKEEVNINDGVTATTNYNYTSGDKRYVKEVLSEGSSSETLRTVYYYPHELVESTGNTSGGGGPIGPVNPDPTGSPRVPSLFNKNILSQPIRVESYENNELISSVETKYDSQALPEEIITAKGAAPEETRMKFEVYDDEKNLLQARQEDGIPVSFIWGYDKRYVIAKITNIEYNTIPSSLINNVHSASDTGTESLLLSRLNTLQNHSSLANAQMTYYTYKPNIGVSTMTDVSGYRMKYFYDDFQRLERVEDQDGKVLSENEYNYKN